MLLMVSDGYSGLCGQNLSLIWALGVKHSARFSHIDIDDKLVVNSRLWATRLMGYDSKKWRTDMALTDEWADGLTLLIVAKYMNLRLRNDRGLNGPRLPIFQSSFVVPHSSFIIRRSSFVIPHSSYTLSTAEPILP